MEIIDESGNLDGEGAAQFERKMMRLRSAAAIVGVGTFG
jgi:hypothetical protein